MALTNIQQALLLFKKWLGKAQTTTARDFYEEPYSGRSSVLPTQIWQNADQIPLTPIGFSASGQAIGVVQYLQDVSLTAVLGTTNSFYSSQLADAIPFNYGDGISYNYAVKNNVGDGIAFGIGDWILDTEAGVLTFYSSVPASMPPTVTAYKYVGLKGFPTSSATSSYALTAETASYALTVPPTASYATQALSASWAPQPSIPETGSYALQSLSSSYSETSSYAANVPETSSYALQALTASYALSSSGGSSISSSWASASISASYALTSSYASNVPLTASYALATVSSSYAEIATTSTTSSYALNFVTSSTIVYALTASYALHADNADVAGDAYTAHVATQALNAYQADVADALSQPNSTTAGFATTASYATKAESTPLATTASYATKALSASYAPGNIAISASYAYTASIASKALTASNADHSTLADQATSADYASTVGYADYAAAAGNAAQAVSASHADISDRTISASYASIAGALNFTPPTASYAVSSAWAPPLPPGVPVESASWAAYAVTASYIQLAKSASYSLSGSYVVSASHANIADNASTSSYSIFAVTSTSSSYASVATNAGTASFFNPTPESASFATASWAFEAIFTSNSMYADTASLAFNAYSAAYAPGNPSLTSSLAFYADDAGTASLAIRAYNADTASYVYRAINANTASLAIRAYDADNAGYAATIPPTIVQPTASYALKSTNATTASYLEPIPGVPSIATASYAINSTNATSSSYGLYAVTSSFTDVALTASYWNPIPGQPSFATASYASRSANSDTATSASYAYKATNADNAGLATYATNAGYAPSASQATNLFGFVQVEITGSTIIDGDVTIKPPHTLTADTIIATNEFQGDLFGSSSYAVTSSYAANIPLKVPSSSYADFASSSADLVGYGYIDLNGPVFISGNVLVDSDYAVTASNFLGNLVGTASFAQTASIALNAPPSIYATSASYASSSTSASYAITASAIDFIPESSSYALSASWAPGGGGGSSPTASYISGGMVIMGLPTDGEYGGISGSIAGIGEGDRVEDAMDKIEVIFAKLAPGKPADLRARTIVVSNPYTARSASNGTIYTNVTTATQARISWTTTPATSGSGTNLSYNADAGTLRAGLDGTFPVWSTASFTPALSTSAGTLIYGHLQIEQIADPYQGTFGQQSFWRGFIASVIPITPLSIGAHTAQLSHSLTGATPICSFSIDNPRTPIISSSGANTITGSATTSGTRWVSGVPSLATSDTVTVNFTSSHAVSQFYNSTKINEATSTVTNTLADTLPVSPPPSASVVSSSIVLSVQTGRYSAAPTFTGTAYNSQGTTGTAVWTPPRLIRVDTVSSEASRVKSGIGRYPSIDTITGTGAPWTASASLTGSRDLQMINGIYQYPVASNYTTNYPTAGPDYSALSGDAIGSVGGGPSETVRWATFSSSVTTAGTLLVAFSGTSNFTGVETTGSMRLYVKVSGSSPTNGWIDGSTAYPGVGNPTNDGDYALMVAAGSTTTNKYINLGGTRTGVAFVRVGIPSSSLAGSNRTFTGVTLTVTG